jgi:hypothetical protein
MDVHMMPLSEKGKNICQWLSLQVGKSVISELKEPLKSF